MIGRRTSNVQLFERQNGTEFLAHFDIDNEVASEARDSLRRRDFESAEQLLDSAEDENDRSYYAEALADWRGHPKFLRDWLVEYDSPNAKLVNAIHAVKWAWEARTGEVASKVSDDQVAEFMKRLDYAEKRLKQAASADKRDATVFSWLIFWAMGCSDPDAAEAMFRRALKRTPNDRTVYSIQLMALTARWFGSDEESMAFARRCAEKGCRGIGLETLPIEARWFTATGGDDNFSTYWQGPNIRSVVMAADESCRKHPATGMNKIRTAQWLAFGLYVVGETKACRRRLKESGDVPLLRPWLTQEFFEGAWD